MNLSNLVEDYCTQLRRRYAARGPCISWTPGCPPRTRAPAVCRQIQGSYRCAKKTAELLRALITKERHPDAASLIEDIRMVGIKVQAAKPVGEWPQQQKAAALGLDTCLHPVLIHSSMTMPVPVAVFGCCSQDVSAAAWCLPACVSRWTTCSCCAACALWGAVARHAPHTACLYCCGLLLVSYCCPCAAPLLQSWPSATLCAECCTWSGRSSSSRAWSRRSACPQQQHKQQHRDTR